MSARQQKSYLPNWAQTIAVLTATLGALSDGMQYGWTSPAVPLLKSDDSPVKIQDSDEFWLETIYMIGGVAGLPFTILAVDTLGRKWSVLLASTQTLIAWIMISVARDTTVLFIARFLTGMAGDCAFVSAPMYIAEIADPKVRGILGTFIYILMIIGVLIAYCVVPFVPLYASSLVGVCIGITQLLTFVWMPESPYFLLLKNKVEKATDALRWFRRTKDVDEEMKEISAAVERQSSERGRFVDLLLIKSNRKALLIMVILNISQHFCGISVILMNVQSILQESGSLISTEMSAILFGCMMLLASVCGSPCIDKFGRKVLLISSSLLSALFLGILGVYFYIKDKTNIDTTGYEAVPLFAVLAYAVAFKFGLGLVPIVTNGELFPTSVKSKGMTIADLMYTTMAIASIALYSFTSKEFGMYLPFIIFSICGVCTSGFVYWIMPETKGRTLEEIQQILKGNYVAKL